MEQEKYNHRLTIRFASRHINMIKDLENYLDVDDSRSEIFRLLLEAIHERIRHSSIA